ncbi:DNA primase [Mycoplasma wenyonii]|uniref:DNA primase n=1 Tax=Mycoplasma wenyonii TaxID=65123 RepID=A0A328PW31_9MOLU|nr:CHC2 zinc finger domain-containing protein [Mycoplasma wenyonii]RAO95339.1 DNA primase [Mycoplasma wenyonii]
MERNKLNIKEVIGSYLTLEKRGRNYWALCPFHEDNKPSLSISEEKNIFKCFSCGISGDAVSFIMRKDKMNSQDALIHAHKLLKLPIENVFDARTSREYQFKQKLIKFNNFVSEFFVKHLFSAEGKPALDYLTQERRLTLNLIKQAKIGYAPKGQVLLQALEKIKKSSEEYQFIEPEFLLKTGIFSPESRKNKDTLIALFQERITIPIFSILGELIGFSSRALPTSKSEIKYLHSKETLLFKKVHLLYNLPALTNVSREPIYLFEGFFDLFALSLLKPHYKALALMGRELSADTLDLLKKQEVKKIVLVLDTDKSGISAAMKIIQQLLKVGIEPYSLNLDFKGAKDFSELYCSNPAIELTEPIYFVDWIKCSWKKYINNSSPETELLSLNQIVNTLLIALFIGEPNYSFRLQPNLEAQFTIDSLNAIFKLYELIELSKKEKEVISAKQNSYLEAINLYFLSPNKREVPKRMELSRRQQEQPKNIISNFSSILALWSNVLKSKSNQEIIQKKLTDWKSQSLEDYSELFQWILLPEERLFLNQLQDNLSTTECEDTSTKSSKSQQSSFSKLWDFFELYYSLIHSLLEKSEKYLQTDSLTEWPIKLDWLKKIETDREELKHKSSNIFNRLLELEKS